MTELLEGPEDYQDKIERVEEEKRATLEAAAAELAKLEERRVYLLGVLGKKKPRRKRTDAGKPRGKKALGKGLTADTPASA